jgi:Holliday junction resolvase-like predicted endonuclease
MKTTLIGNEAEEQVAETLSSDGYKILAQNWRTRVCEIDIVASKDKIV